MTVLLLVGLAILAAWALRPVPAPRAAAPVEGVEIRLPPIPLTGVSPENAESILSRLQPIIRPRFFPLGWTVTWPSVEIPTDFGTAKVDVPPVELPFVPYGQVVSALEHLRPQIVTTENGLALQVTGRFAFPSADGVRG